MVAGVTDALTEARAELVAALRTTLAGILPTSRVLDVKPSKPATPNVWLSPFGMTPDTVGEGAIPVVSLTGSVIAPLDGDTGPAVRAADLMQSAIWEAINTIGTPTGSSVGPIDVGGPTLYAVTVTFTLTVAVTSICPLVLVSHEAVHEGN